MPKKVFVICNLSITGFLSIFSWAFLMASFFGKSIHDFLYVDFDPLFITAAVFAVISIILEIVYLIFSGLSFKIKYATLAFGSGVGTLCAMVMTLALSGAYLWSSPSVYSELRNGTLEFMSCIFFICTYIPGFVLQTIYFYQCSKLRKMRSI